MQTKQIKILIDIFCKIKIKSNLSNQIFLVFVRELCISLIFTRVYIALFSRTISRLYVKETHNESESDLTVLQSRSKIQTCKVFKHEAYCHCLRYEKHIIRQLIFKVSFLFFKYLLLFFVQFLQL